MRKVLQKNDKRRALHLRSLDLKRNLRLVWGKQGRFYFHSRRHQRDDLVKGPNEHPDAHKRWLEYKNEASDRWDRDFFHG